MTATERPRRQAAPIQPVEAWTEEPRFDAAAKVTGGAKYLDDMVVPPGTLHAAILRSPYSHARIVSIDASDALAVPGVFAVFDRDHLYGVNPDAPITEYLDEGEYAGVPGGKGTGPADQCVIATDKVRFDGDQVAVLVADDPRTAHHAVGLIRVEYETLPGVYSYEDALAPDAPILHERLGSNVAHEDSFEWGDVDAGFAEADEVFEETWSGGNAFHHPMEPATPSLVDYRGDQVAVWTSSHKPFLVQNMVADVFHIPAETVRVRIPYIGGAFGAKQMIPAIISTLALSKATGRPVKYVPTDAESFRATSRHFIEYRAKVGVKSDGTIVALDVFLAIDTGAYFTGAALVTHNACISAWGCYRLKNFRVRAKTVYTNKVPSASFRSTGKNQTTFGVESTLDAVGRRMGISPLDIRLKNALRRGEYIADTWKVKGREYPSDTPPMDTDYDNLMDLAVKGIDWDGRTVNTAPPAPDAKVARGRGLSISLRHGAQGGGRAHAMAGIARNGDVTIYHNSPDLGTGSMTIISVIAAHAMGIPRDQVRVVMPDTANPLPFGGTSAQRTTVQMGNAVKAACEDLKREIIDAATQTMGGTHADWRVVDGRVCRGDEAYTYAEALHAFPKIQLRGVGAYSYAPSIDKAFGGLDSWGPGAAAAEVEVDLETGVVRVVKYCAVGDAGKVIHRGGAAGQVMGGAMMGISLALGEELHYSDSGLENGSAFDYRLGRAADLPEHFVTEIVEKGDGPGPWGAKGLAQPSTVCAAPAVGNAIRDAIGTYVRHYPFTPERVLRTADRLTEE